MKRREGKSAVADKRKFAALAELHRQPPEEAMAPDTAMEPVSRSAVTPDAAKGRGRPPTGKRSNPDWKLYSHFLKRKTQRAAVARLQADDDGRDLSDVLQELLENWLKI
jgi:hypothetical protein